MLGSGAEERNSRWADSRRRYEAGFGVKTVDDLHGVIAFFEERRGRLHGFRWKDWTDYKSCVPKQAVSAGDQSLGAGDGETDTFQLVKAYGSAFAPWTREIAKPVAGTVMVAVDGVAQTEDTHFTLDAATGRIIFTAGNIPEAGQAVSAGFEFDVPVRFDTDQLAVNLRHIEAGDIPNIPVVEIHL
ncbi:DUF2460 domain-containing protein [Methyloligella sp. 2.7D]|uniref:DUF2460 domain-containing protein n=1 Tax=unclassified Methyloligella TaxID=2625955 RepID=UPI002FDA9056